MLRSARHVHVSSYYLQRKLQATLKPLLVAARDGGASVSLDPNWDPDETWDGGLLALLPLLDYLFVNEQEARLIGRADDALAAARALACNGPTVVVKLGGSGGLSVSGAETIRAPALPRAVVDTTGAGDSFDAGFLLRSACRLGSQLAALSSRVSVARCPSQLRASTANRRLTRHCASVLECAHNERSRAYVEHVLRAFAALDPLTADEISAVTSTVRAAPQFASLSGRTRFITITLREPHKDGGACPARRRTLPSVPREADVVLLDQGDGMTHEVVVSVADETIVEWRARDGVQPLATVAELGEAEELVRLDPRFQAALKLRGVTDFEKIQVDAWPAGNFGYDDEVGLRLARCLAFVRDRPGDNEWAHPVDGLIALVDLNRLEVLRVDDHGVVPVPPEPGNFDPESVGPLSNRHHALEIIAARGPELRRRRQRRHVAEVAAARRLHPSRGARSEPGELPGRRSAAIDPVPRVAVRDGRAVRRSEPDPLLQERVRRRRERRRNVDLLAAPRL